MTLTEFIAARLDEDEASVADDPGWADSQGNCYECGTNVDRLKREVAAKRAILALHSPDAYGKCIAEGDPDDSASLDDWPCLTVLHLAAVWSDHPDYDAAWNA